MAARGPLPVNVNDIRLPDAQRNTIDGTDWLIAECEMLGFSTPENHRHLANAEKWYMDGTFRVSKHAENRILCTPTLRDYLPENK